MALSPHPGVEAATLTCAALTAYCALYRRLHVREGDIVLVHAAAGGVGGPMCAQLSSDFGIYATRVNSGSPARKKDEFANADAEKWFAFRRLLEKRKVILPIDGELLKQLSSRRLHVLLPD